MTRKRVMQVGVAVAILMVATVAGYVALSNAQDRPGADSAWHNVTDMREIWAAEQKIVIQETYEVGTFKWSYPASNDERATSIRAVVAYPFGETEHKFAYVQVGEDVLHADEIVKTLQTLSSMIHMVEQWTAEPSNPEYETCVSFSTRGINFYLRRPSESAVQRMEANDLEYRERKKAELERLVQADVQQRSHIERLKEELETELPNRRQPYLTGTLPLPAERLAEFKALLERARDVLTANDVSLW